MSTRLQHVNLPVPPGRTEECVPFYELLGLRRVPKPTEGVRPSGAWLDLPDGWHQVHLSERAGTPHPEQHLALVVEDLDGLAARLIEQGHPWAWKADVLGARRGETRDPVGNLVELLAAEGSFAD